MKDHYQTERKRDRPSIRFPIQKHAQSLQKVMTPSSILKNKCSEKADNVSTNKRVLFKSMSSDPSQDKEFTFMPTY